MSDIYYEGVVAGTAADQGQAGTTAAVIAPNARFQVFAVGDRSNPLPIKSLYGVTSVSVQSSSLGAVPDVYVQDPAGAFSHDWVSGSGPDAFVWRRNSFDHARKLVEEARDAAQQLAAEVPERVTAEVEAVAATGAFKGEPGKDGANVATTRAAVAGELQDPASPSRAALSAMFVPAIVVAGSDAASVHAARNAAGVGGTVYFPPRTYTVTTLLANVAGQQWIFAAGSLLKIADGSNADAIQISAPDVTLTGPVIEGNKANQTNGSGGILVNGERAVVDRAVINNARGVAINVVRSNASVNDCRISESGDAGIGVTATASGSISNISVTNNTITNTAIGPYGIRIKGETPATANYIRVTGNHVSLPAGNTSGLCIEIFGKAHNATVSNNTTVGGRMGISVDKSDNASVSGNSIIGASAFGLEVVGALNASITANTVDGAGVTARCLSISTNTKYATVSANSFQGWAPNGFAVHASSTDHIVFGGNSLRGPYQPIILQSVTNFLMTGNMVAGQGTSQDGVNLDACSSGTIATNSFDGFTRSAVIAFNGTMAGLIIGPNHLTGGTPNVPLFTGGTAVGVGSRVNGGNMTTAQRLTPAVAGVGGTYYDTTLNKQAYSDGAAWTAGAVSSI